MTFSEYTQSLGWGNWVVAKKSASATRRYQKWDAESRTYIPPRFISRLEYLEARQDWLMGENAQIQFRLEDAENTIKELQAEVEGKDAEISDLENQLAEVEDKLDDKDTYADVIAEDIEWAKTYLRMGLTQDVLITLERIR